LVAFTGGFIAGIYRDSIEHFDVDNSLKGRGWSTVLNECRACRSNFGRSNPSLNLALNSPLCRTHPGQISALKLLIA
jgi:hypothetical protein